ncbi:hypothetical protein M1558_01150 [Candidatus Parvarchaeota archaeon]|nr:hypothetical protein [Candidatus Parvarchaeota archaeon]
METKMAIIILIIIAAVIIAFLLLNKPEKSTAALTFLQKENLSHVFSSPTLSFNFSSDFYLVNTTGLLISQYYNSARFYYNYNTSVIISVIQNKTNKSSGYFYKLIYSEFNDSNYSFQNISVKGYNGLKVISDKAGAAYALAFIFGPSGYYTAVFISDPFSQFINVSDSALNKILQTISFGPSPYI